MPNQEHLELLMQGQAVWNAWRQKNPDTVPFLRSARLEKLDLSGYDLHDAYLKRANLKDANLHKSNLREANLNGAHLENADLTEADMAGVSLRSASLRGADLRQADLKTASLVNADLRKARLDGAHVYGISAWEVRLDGAEQRGLVVTRPGQPRITADDLEVAQFVYVLLNHSKLLELFNTTTHRCVLLLGRFREGGLEALRAIGDRLREMSYLPIIFDFERPEGRTLTETVTVLAGLCGFVIVDLSSSSVPQELQATVKDVRIPFVPILEKGREAPSMIKDFFSEDNFFFPPIGFTTIPELLESLPEKVVSRAEKYLEDRKARLALYDKL